MYIRGLIPRNFAELAEAVSIDMNAKISKLWPWPSSGETVNVHRLV